MLDHVPDCDSDSKTESESKTESDSNTESESNSCSCVNVSNFVSFNKHETHIFLP